MDLQWCRYYIIIESLDIYFLDKIDDVNMINYNFLLDVYLQGNCLVGRFICLFKLVFSFLFIKLDLKLEFILLFVILLLVVNGIQLKDGILILVFLVLNFSDLVKKEGKNN